MKPVLELKNVTICYPNLNFKFRASRVSNDALKERHWMYREINPILQNISFSCIPGTITCIVGNNGTGKSTLLKAIAGLIPIKSGQLLRSTNIFGYVPEQCAIPQWLTAYDALWYATRFCKKTTNKETILAALQQVNLYDHAYKHIESFSKGMKQRLAFAEILVLNPELILLDEPFSGLDTASKKIIEQLIFEFKTQNKTILCTAHTDDEIAADQCVGL